MASIVEKEKYEELKLYRNKTKVDQRIFLFGFNNPMTIIPGGTVKFTKKQAKVHYRHFEPVIFDKQGLPDKPGINKPKRKK